MKSISFIVMLCAIVCFSLSCEKDCPDPSAKDENPRVLLEIKPNQNTYIAEDGNRFYTKVFTSKNDTNLYRLKVNKGEKYHLYCIQPDLKYTPGIKMVLFNTDNDTISYSRNDTGKSELFFTSSYTGEVNLTVYLNSKYNETLSYNLYFESNKPLAMRFMNLNWETTGDWRIVNAQTLEFRNYDSREYRWIRLNLPVADNLNVQFRIKSSGKITLPSLGFIVNASSELMYWGDYQEELPQKGEFLNIVNNEEYKVLHLNGPGIGFNYGTFSLPIIDMNTGVNIWLKPTNSYTTVLVNNVETGNLPAAIANYFYLVIEDIGFETITFENITLEQVFRTN